MSLLPKSRARIRREAADWKVRLGEAANDDVRAEFRRWHDADARHAEAYARMSAIWGESADLSPALAAESRVRPAFASRAPARLALAASVAAVVVLVSLLFVTPRWLGGVSSSGREMEVLATAIGEIRQVELPDGSLVILDSASRVEARYSPAERRLVLVEGRARFRVAHEARPFLVRAGFSEIVATGTLFDVSLVGGRTAVLLLEGAVRVRAVSTPGGEAAQPLQPGQKLVLFDAGPPIRGPVQPADTVWPSRMLEFDETPLEEAIALANRYSRVQLRIGDERIRVQRVSGSYRAGDIAGFARGLAGAFDLQVERQPDGDLLLRASNVPAGD